MATRLIAKRRRIAVGGLIPLLPLLLAADATPAFSFTAATRLLISLLIIPGAFGGVLYGAKSGELRLPCQVAAGRYDLGIIADLLFGIAGGLLVFVVVPGELKPDNDLSIVKIIGLAIVLGYAGRSAVDTAASQQFKALAAKTDRLEQGQTAASLLADFLDVRTEDTPARRDVLATALKAAPATNWPLLFRAAEAVREANWQEAARSARGDPSADTRTKDLLERCRFAFQTLYDAGHQQDHRILASIGYVDRDMDRPAAAVPELEHAIELAANAKDKPHALYHFALAVSLVDAESKRPGGHVSQSNELLRARVQPNLDLAVQLQPALAELVNGLKGSGVEVPVFDRNLQKYLTSSTAHLDPPHP